jgi:hypothetical protein
MVRAEPLGFEAVLATTIEMMGMTVMAVPTVRRCAGLSGKRCCHHQQDHKRDC